MSKELKGSLLYVYHGRLYIDKPKNTKIAKTEYNENEHLTYVYLRFDFHILEFVTVLILIACILIRVYASRYLTSNIHIPESMSYYNNTLYAGVVVDKPKYGNISINILDNEYSMDSTDYVYTIHCDTKPDKVDVIVTYKLWLFNVSQTYTIQQINSYAEED